MSGFSQCLNNVLARESFVPNGQARTETMPARPETMPPCGPRGRLWGSPVPLFSKAAANSGSRALAGRRRELAYSDGPRNHTLSEHQVEAGAMRAASRAPHSGLDREHEICMCSRSRHEGEDGKSCAERKGSPSYFREAGPTRCRCNPPGKVVRQEDQLGRATVPASPVTLSSARGSNCASPCQGDSFRQCSRRGSLTNTPSDTSTSASGKSSLSLLRGGSLTPWPAKQRQTVAVGQVTLRDWFFVRCEDGEAGDVDPGNPKIALGGIYISESFERQVVRTTRIVERLKKHLLRTIDGVDVWLSGRMDVESTVANGFSLKIVQQFCTGFPSMWKPFLERSVPSGEHDIKEQATLAHGAHPQLYSAVDGCVCGGVTDEQPRSHVVGLTRMGCKDLETSKGDTGKRKGEELVCGSTGPEVNSHLRAKEADIDMCDTIEQPLPLAHSPGEPDCSGATSSQGNTIRFDAACTEVSEREVDVACTEVSEREAVSNIHEESGTKNLSKNQKRRLNRRCRRKQKKQRIADAEVVFIADEEDQSIAQEYVYSGRAMRDEAVCQEVEIDTRDEGVGQEAETDMRNEDGVQDVEIERRDERVVSQGVGIERRDEGVVAQEVGIERRDEGVDQEVEIERRDEGVCQEVEMRRREDGVFQDVEIEMWEEAVCQEVQIEVSLLPVNGLEDKLHTELVKDACQTAVPCMTLRSSGSLTRQSKTSVRTPDKMQGAVSPRPRRRRSSIIPPPAAAPLIPVSPDMVSKAFGLKTSRSGRLLVPPLAFWRNQTAVHDKDGGIIAIMDGFDREEDPDTGRYNFERPTEKQAVRLQRKLHKVVQRLQSPSVVRKGRS